MGMPRKHQRNAVVPQMVGFLGDVRKGQAGQIAAQPRHCLVQAGMAGVRVVEPDQLNLLPPHGEDRVLIAQHLNASAPQSKANLIGARPMVVIAQHRKHRHVKAPHELGQLIEIDLAVANKIAGHHHKIRPLRVHQRLRFPLNSKRRDPANVQVGHVGNPHARHRSRILGRPREPTNFNPASPALCNVARRTHLRTAT